MIIHISVSEPLKGEVKWTSLTFSATKGVLIGTLNLLVTCAAECSVYIFLYELIKLSVLVYLNYIPVNLC